LVGQHQPGGALVVEIGERAFGQFACGLLRVRHESRVADRADAARGLSTHEDDGFVQTFFALSPPHPFDAVEVEAEVSKY